MGVGEKIKEILKDRGMTIKELAEESELSPNTLYSITKTDPLSIQQSTAEKIAYALGIDASDLSDFERGVALATGISYASLSIAKKADEIAKVSPEMGMLAHDFLRLNVSGHYLVMKYTKHLLKNPDYQKNSDTEE